MSLANGTVGSSGDDQEDQDQAPRTSTVDATESNAEADDAMELHWDDHDLPTCQSDIQPTIAGNISLARAYLYCITLGFFGAHYYYLGRRTAGFLYTATLGFLGIGWVVDWFRLPSLVETVRKARREEAENGYVLYAVPYGHLEERSVVTAYLYAIPPWGFFGIHHMYLGTFRKNEIFYLIYVATLGFLGFGWIFDIFRIPKLVRRANENIRDLRAGRLVSSTAPSTLHLDTAYSLAFPLGLIGLHHFYLRRPLFGCVYILTLGLVGVGVVIDLIRLKRLFRRTIRELRDFRHTTYRLDDAYILWFPLGLLGLHHFYLRRWKMGVVYLCTFGVLGVGWLIDAFRMRSLVEASNKRLDANLLWDESMTRRNVKNTNMNVFVDSKLYNYPTTDEDGNIQVYAFPLKPNGKPSWLLGWAWFPSSTNHNGLVGTDDERCVLQVQRDTTETSDENIEGAIGWSSETAVNSEFTIA